jgi:primosomal protein N' (replication factor Y)
LTDQQFHLAPTTDTYVSVVLPLAVPKPYTYYVPEEWIAMVQPGVRVEVQFGKNRHYTGIVVDVHHEAPVTNRIKSVLAVIDDAPIVLNNQLQFWRWMSEYYACSLGEVMNAALPANLKLASETVVTLSPMFEGDFTGLDDKEYMVAEALTIQNELSIEDVKQIIQQKTVYPVIRRMLEKRIIYLKEDLKEKYKPKTIACVRLQEPYASQPETLQAGFDLLSRSTRQVEALMAYIQIARQKNIVRKEEVYQAAKVDSTVLAAMEKKGIFELYQQEISRIGGYGNDLSDADPLSTQQERAIAEIKEAFSEKNVVLLQGVTGSGKTRVYIELMQEAIQKGEQVLYLLPEIALTTQIISRLQKVLGDQVAIYHSRLNNNERVELWNAVLEGKPVVLGARSALFLPFKNLSTIIVDEEHDPSFKQQDPNPRYQGRDAAIYLAKLFDAKVLLGTATPSVESYFNAQSGKYGLVRMSERFGNLKLPETQIVDVKQEMRQRRLQAHFTSTLLEAMKATLERGEQVILFQNRRGFAPTYRCDTCDWHSECIHCDVSLTYHKAQNNLKCHYCGYQTKLPKNCPACGSAQLTLQGFGTEKIEDDLKIYLPEAKIGRMDLDTVRSKNAHAQIINDFEEGRINVLVGTQMVTKGLDFERVGLVGILSADQLLQFPDFRASERAFQLMLQVAGRAGRKHEGGKVIIQSLNTTHPVLKEVMENDFFTFIQRELQERYHYKYPPFYRLIRITLKHKRPEVLNEAAQKYGHFLYAKLSDRLRGPAVPYVSRVRGFYIMDFLIKLERQPKLIAQTKALIAEAGRHLQQELGYSTIRIQVDVDPG